MAKKRRQRVAVNVKYLFAHSIELECDDLLSFVQSMAAGLQSQTTTFESFLDRMTKGLDESRKSEAVEFYADDAFGLLERYPRILWQSVFISLYSFFEQEMNDICRRCRRIADDKGIPKTRISKPNGVALPAQKCLLELGVRLATRAADWKRMTGYVGVRNLIAHNRGRLRKDGDESEQVKRFVRYAKHITLDQHQNLVLEKEFCVTMIKTMHSVLKQIISAIPERLFQS